MPAVVIARVLCENGGGGIVFVAALAAGGVCVDIVIAAPIVWTLALPSSEQPLRLRQVLLQSPNLCIASIDGGLCIVFIFGEISAWTL